MKKILNLSIGTSQQNYKGTYKFQGVEFSVQRLGCDYDLELLYKLLEHYDGQVDAIALTGLPPSFKNEKSYYTHPVTQKARSIPKDSFLCDGNKLRDTFAPWVLREYIKENPRMFSKKVIGFYSGVVQKKLVDVVSEYTDRLLFFDAFISLSIPKILKGLKSLSRFSKIVVPLMPLVKIEKTRYKKTGWSTISEKLSKSGFNNCEIIIANSSLVERLPTTILESRTLITDYIPPHMEQEYKNTKIKKVISTIPRLVEDKRIDYPTAEAILQIMQNTSLDYDDILEWISKLELKAKVHIYSQEQKNQKLRFAFIIHPLSAEDLFRHPLIKPVRNSIQNIPKLERFLEKSISFIPGIHYGNITGIRSTKNSKEIEGLIYTIFDTPREMLSKSPENIYRKLVAIAEDAAAKGADIIGLGAYTKIVGDAGITVSERSPIPVTTGNSLSAASALWAARIALQKMGFVTRKRDSHILNLKAMIIGATGSIGAASAKLIAQIAEETILVAPRGYKLLELKKEIEDICKNKNPNTKISICSDPNKLLMNCQLVVTSTSVHEGKVLDMEQVMPGAVICDVSRPLNISEEDAQKRPDVLVIASGEIELPGDKVSLNCDIGLHGNVVYACLAETALLALEGRMESFTLSRSIDYKKIIEIYDIAIKHGAKLSAMYGHNGVITDKEIELCKEHAKKRIQEAKENTEYGSRWDN